MREIQNGLPGVPHGSILGPILFLVYIDDLIRVVTSDIRIFAEDTFIFRIVDSTSAVELIKDLEAITRWANQWILELNPTIDKQAIELLFSKKRIKSVLDPLIFNNILIKQADESFGAYYRFDFKLQSTYRTKNIKSEIWIGVNETIKKMGSP